MLAVYLKEINLFFSSLIGYVVLAVFLVVTSIFLWVLPQFNVFEAGYATLQQYFQLAPFIFWFLVPAVAMRSLSEEYRSGTIELLATKPITDAQLVVGKYAAGVTLLLIALAPTLLYYYTIAQLASTPDAVDSGATIGSLIGLAFLGAVFMSIGIFSSSISVNQIIAFIVGVLLCFTFYSLFSLVGDSAVDFTLANWLTNLSLEKHYASISRGVVDTRDIIYFLSVIVLFLSASTTVVASRRW